MKRAPGQAQPFLIGMAIGLLIGVLVLDIVMPSGVVTGVVYVSLVMMSLASDKRTLTFLAAFAFTGLIAFDHLDYLIAMQNPLDASWPMIGRLALIVLGIWIPFFAALATKRVQEHVELVGTPLHLCPTCKKIRDDRGTWTKVDEFIQQQMGREAAPGMCPGCRSKWAAGQAGYHHL